jgi:hypothetical protein
MERQKLVNLISYGPTAVQRGLKRCTGLVIPVYLFCLFVKGMDHKSVNKGRDAFLTFSDASPLGNKYFYILTVNASSTPLH